MATNTKKVTLKQIAEYLNVDDLKITDGSSGTMYTARSRNTAHDRHRIFVAWDKKCGSGGCIIRGDAQK